MPTAEQWGAMLRAILESIVFSTIGIVFFAVVFLLIKAVVPFSIRKEIEEDQNTALAVVIGSVFLGVAIIVASVLHGG